MAQVNRWDLECFAVGNTLQNPHHAIAIVRQDLPRVSRTRGHDHQWQGEQETAGPPEGATHLAPSQSSRSETGRNSRAWIHCSWALQKEKKQKKRNWHYTLHTNQNEHILYRKRGSGVGRGAWDLPECEGGNCCVKEDVLSLFTGGQ